PPTYPILPYTTLFRSESRSYLRHDLAHFAIELELPIRKGYWGCVAYGASLTGEGVEGEDAQLAETLAGPIQTLFRIEAGPEAYIDRKSTRLNSSHVKI